MTTHAPFGSPVPFAEPSWYQGMPTPYYGPEHVAYRARVREFVETQLRPHADKWIAAREYPMELHRIAYEAGITGVVWPEAVGGAQKGERADYFFELIRADEVARLCGGHILGQEGINSMALPPIIKYGSPELVELVVKPTVQGRTSCCLAISEAWAGSDVAGIRCTARREGDVFVVNGVKKWITGGAKADFFTTAVRTADTGGKGISLLLIPRSLAGIQVRKMDTQFDSAHSTTMVTLEDVRVPARFLIGKENHGFKMLLENFNHERWIIAVSCCREARECYREAFEWAIKRQTFGKPLMNSQVIRAKLANMARQVEAVQDMVERVAFAFSQGVPDSALGAQCALLKVQATTTFEYCAREATQVFGGSGVVREGAGMLVE